MIIQKGKSYKNRKGKKVTITNYVHDSPFPFRDENGETFRASGSYMGDPLEHINDLVCEWEEIPDGGIPYPEFESFLTILGTHQWSKIDEAVASLKARHNLK